jgi:hypothetical protein
VATTHCVYVAFHVVYVLPNRPFSNSNLSTALPRTSSLTEMSDTIYNLWCYVGGDKNLFSVKASSIISVYDLKKMIKEELKNSVLKGFDAADLTLTKVGYIMIFM